MGASPWHGLSGPVKDFGGREWEGGALCVFRKKTNGQQADLSVGRNQPANKVTLPRSTSFQCFGFASRSFCWDSLR